MELYLDLFIMFCFGFYIGQKVFIYQLRNTLKQEAAKLGIDLEQETTEEELESLPPRCVIEKHGDQLYLYDKDTNDFYCQARNLESLAEALYNNRKIDLAHVVNNNDKMWFVKGKISQSVVINEG